MTKKNICDGIIPITLIICTFQLHMKSFVHVISQKRCGYKTSQSNECKSMKIIIFLKHYSILKWNKNCVKSLCQKSILCIP